MVVVKALTYGLTQLARRASNHQRSSVLLSHAKLSCLSESQSQSAARTSPCESSSSVTLMT